MIFDTHAHYDDEQFDVDREELLNSMHANGIGTIVNVGASLESTKQAVELSEQYPFLYAAVGIHPNEVGTLNEENFAEMKKLFEKEKVVAVGEIGLDYHYPKPPKDVQKLWFERQVELAREKKLPILIHSREAAKDTLDLMKAWKTEEIGGVIHCFSYGVEMAREYLNMGFYLGIGGVLTFPNAKKLKEVVAYMPLEQLVLETDCPYLAPVPNRGKRNSSLNLPYVVEEIAQIKKMDVDTVIQVTEDNAKRMYGL